MGLLFWRNAISDNILMSIIGICVGFGLVQISSHLRELRILKESAILEVDIAKLKEDIARQFNRNQPKR